MATAAGPILRVEELRKQYGGVHAVDGVSFTVEKQSVTGLIGPNGAGKSTVLAVISGFLTPSGGRINFDGQDVTGQPMHRLAKRGLVRTFQMARCFGNLTAMENVLVGAQRQPGESALGVVLGRRYWGPREKQLVDEARELLDRFGLGGKEDEPGRNLSGGQKRIVELARALMTKPKLLLLDEPMAGLNPTLARKFEDTFLALVEEGLSMLLVEHELDTVERICGKVVVMAQGKVLSEGRMAELRTRREVQDAYVVG